MDKVRSGIVGAKFAADIHCESYSRNKQAEVAAAGVFCIWEFIRLVGCSI